MRRMPIFKGVRIQEFPSVNVSTFGFSRESLTKPEIDAFRARSVLDMRLYAWCLDRFRAA